jgi:hypothetical protein
MRKDPYPLTFDALTAQLGRTPTGQLVFQSPLLFNTNIERSADRTYSG